VVFGRALRPFAVGFIGAICRQRRLPMELQWRGIFARDALCSTPPGALDQPYDAVVVLPRYASTPGVWSAGDLAGVHAALIEAAAQGSPPFHAGARRFVETELFALRPGIAAFSRRYPQRVAIAGHLVFFDPTKAVAARTLRRGQ